MTSSQFLGHVNAEAPGTGSAAVTPSDTVELSPIARSLYVEAAGNVKFTAIDGTVDTWAVPANFVIPVAVKLVWSTGTTSTGIHAIR